MVTQSSWGDTDAGPASPAASPSGRSDQPRLRVIGLRFVPAGELRSNSRRWRSHPQAQRRALEELLRRIGIAGALVAREADDGLLLLDGHLRKDLALDTVLPVIVVDLNEEEADLFLASFDPVGEMAKASHEALARLVASTWVPEDLLQELHRRFPPEGPGLGLTDPESIPAPPPAVRVRRGELWALGEHRVACGDATDPAAIGRLAGSEAIDVLLTDPPYGVGYVGKTKDALRIENDDPDGLQGLLEQSFAAIDQVLAPGGRVYVCHPAGASSITFACAFVGAGWRLHETLVWVKDRMVLGHADYHYRHEPILYGYKAGPGRWGRGHRGWYGGNDADSVLEVPRPAASRDHPTAKPVELVSRLLRNSSAPGDRVLDPFLGSGSTLIACQQLGRRCLGLELDPGYCDVAIRRWEEFTGAEAVRIDG